jgi:hypothetical protein
MTAKRVKKRGHMRAIGEAGPRVGIVYLVGDKLWIEATPVARAGKFGVYAYHEREHEHYWRQLVKRGAAPKTDYTEFPRGRVSYDRRSGAFTLRADRCILREKALIIAILSQMRLPIRRTKTGTDSDYCCRDCKRRRPLTR